jgi:prolipoprotein diacylglyceryltransferase
MLVSLELGEQGFSSYLLFTLLAWLLGGCIFYRAARRGGLSPELTLAIMAGCALGASAGAAAMSVLFVPLSELPARLGDGSAFSGRTVIGGIAGGFVGVELAKKLVGHRSSTGDAFALAIPPAHALGRIGCFLHGCCFGTPSALPWAVQYPSGSLAHALQIERGWLAAGAPHSLSVHPAPLYELAFDLALWALVLWARPHVCARGNLFRLYLVAYASFRFLAEFARGDSAPPPGWILKPVQLLLLLAALLSCVRMLRRERLARNRNVA